MSQSAMNLQSLLDARNAAERVMRDACGVQRRASKRLAAAINHRETVFTTSNATQQEKDVVQQAYKTALAVATQADAAALLAITDYFIVREQFEAARS